MPPDALPIRGTVGDMLARIPAVWRAPLLRLAGTWLLLVILFRDDWGDMAAQWWNSST
ncbi:MAG: exosortase A, partial [Rhodocyclaceae bacterium]